jgi:DNA helicase HerA-like ATPase
MEKSLPDIDAREILVVLGKTGMGKSNYIKTYLSSLRRVIILDPLDEYPGLEFDDIENMIDFLESENVKDVNKNFKVRSCNILDIDALGEIVADGDKKDDPHAMRNVHLVIEEAQLCLPPSRKELPDSIQRIIFRGRHFGRSLVIAAQRPSIVHIAARSQFTRIVAFNFTENNDVGWLESATGYDILGRQSENDVRQLPIGDYFEITPGRFERKRAPLYIPPSRKEEKEGSEWFMELFAFNT